MQQMISRSAKGQNRLDRSLAIAVGCGIALAFSISAQADITGKVVGVTDGDTITVLDASRIQHRIRLAGIDAPEQGQAGGFRAKESLSLLVYDRQVRVDGNRKDRYGRVVAKVWVAPAECPDCGMTLDAGLAQITMGRAWWYRRHAEDQTREDRERYEFAEMEAKTRRAGLWRDPNPVPPWAWRKGRHQN
jgi:endonuclease YncB( thermonuclease family)